MNYNCSTMPNNETLDQVRERIRRAEAREAEALQDHPGIREVRAAGNELREEKRREEAQREQERARARSDRQEREEAAMRSELRQSYLLEGGTEEGFEEAWAGLREEELARRTLARAERTRARVRADYDQAW